MWNQNWQNFLFSAYKLRVYGMNMPPSMSTSIHNCKKKSVSWVNVGHSRNFLCIRRLLKTLAPEAGYNFESLNFDKEFELFCRYLLYRYYVIRSIRSTYWLVWLIFKHIFLILSFQVSPLLKHVYDSEGWQANRTSGLLELSCDRKTLLDWTKRWRYSLAETVSKYSKQQVGWKPNVRHVTMA